MPSTSGLLDPATVIQNIGKNLPNEVLTSEKTWIFSYTTVRTFKYYTYHSFVCQVYQICTRCQ